MNTEDNDGLFLRQSKPVSPRQWTVEGDLLTIGRDPSSDIFIDDTSVSWHHADLIRRANSWVIADARSTNGTYVDGSRVGEAVIAARMQLRLGRIEFTVGAHPAGPRGSRPPTVSLEAGRFAGPPPGPGPVAGGPLGPPPPPGPPSRPGEPPAPELRIRDQHGQVINNADQIYYIQQQRDNFLRDVAATKTKARWLVWTGFAAFVVGFGLFTYGSLDFMKQIAHAFSSNSEPTSLNPFGQDVGGIPLGLIGAALGSLGSLMLIVGIVLHIVAASRRKRVDQEFPVPRTNYWA